MGYIDKLIEQCHEAKAVKILQEIVIHDADDIEKYASELDVFNFAIYIIEQVDGDAQTAFKEFSDYRSKKERKCSRSNKACSVMYVGSSTTGVRKRLMEHMGEGSRNTYALNLGHWYKGKYKITVRQYDASSRAVLQIVEDELSSKLKPAFGKLGSNSK